MIRCPFYAWLPFILHFGFSWDQTSVRPSRTLIFCQILASSESTGSFVCFVCVLSLPALNLAFWATCLLAYSKWKKKKEASNIKSYFQILRTSNWNVRTWCSLNMCIFYFPKHIFKGNWSHSGKKQTNNTLILNGNLAMYADFLVIGRKALVLNLFMDSWE